jgi:hypothetical protein
LNSGDRERLAGAQERNGPGLGRDGGERGDITAADIFGQGGLNGLADFRRIEFHPDSMAAKPPMEKEICASRRPDLKTERV